MHKMHFLHFLNKLVKMRPAAKLNFYNAIWILQAQIATKHIFQSQDFMNMCNTTTKKKSNAYVNL